MKKTCFARWLLISVPLILGLAGQSQTPPNANEVRWVGTWASSPQLGDEGNASPPPGFTDSTLRQVVHVSLGGKQLRVRFSNAFGTSALMLSSAHVALSAGGSSIKRETDRALRFHGQSAVTIPAGALSFSDTLDFDLPALADITVTVHLNTAPNGITTHPGARATSYLQAGNAVSDPDLAAAAKTDHWYFLNGIDVPTNDAGAAIVTLGDSITDGTPARPARGPS